MGFTAYKKQCKSQKCLKKNSETLIISPNASAIDRKEVLEFSYASPPPWLVLDPACSMAGGIAGNTGRLRWH